MKFKQIATDKYNGYKLSNVNLEVDNAKTNSVLEINDQVTYQTFRGFGGAFTEASAYNLFRISKEKRIEAIKAYFDKENGINYSVGRMSMNGCDFSLGSYDYVKENDISLESFDIGREDKLVIPLIKDAEKIRNEKIPMLISPWSPCYWMKDNNSCIRGGHLLPKYYDAWSSYYVKFIDELTKRDINVFGLTIQNEPAAVQRWDSCIYDPITEGMFAKEYVIPKVKKAYPNMEVFVWDHNRDVILERVKDIYNGDKDEDITGTAIHWYDNEPYENLAKHHDLYPNKRIIHTEGCIECGPHFMVYEHGERYGRNIMGDLNNYCDMFIDWNLFLDETGGPNWVNNLCDAPIMIKIGPEELIYNYSYYYIGQFSKYIKPLAKRVDVKLDSKNLKATAFKNCDGTLAIVIMNETEQDEIIKVKVHGEETEYKVLKKSIITLKEVNNE